MLAEDVQLFSLSVFSYNDIVKRQLATISVRWTGMFSLTKQTGSRMKNIFVGISLGFFLPNEFIIPVSTFSSLCIFR